LKIPALEIERYVDRDAIVLLFALVGFKGEIEGPEFASRGIPDEFFDLPPDGVANLSGPGQLLFP